MNEKTNPWMISTALLIGLIFGFVLGRTIPAKLMTPTNTEQTNVIQNGDVGSPDLNNGTIPSPTPTVTPTPPSEPVSYNNIEMSQDKNGNWTLGKADAKVKIEEFSDYQCPFCHQFFETAFSSIFKNYIAQGKVYYVYYNFPLPFHAQAKKAAEAALCAGEQKKYWDMHDALFNNQNQWVSQDNNMKVYENVASQIGLNAEKFSQCLSSGKFAKQIEKDEGVGQKRGVTGTPTFFINDTQKIVGAQDYSDFQTAIETQLNSTNK